MSRIDNRKNDEMRKIKMTTGFVSSADGSVLIEMGHTRVLCNATLLPEVPKWLAGKGRGWITAEYSLLPQSTGQRVERERKGASGRTQEIQRLVGRSLRGAANLNALGEHALVVDCDVIEADGGTRTASIIGGFVALALALKKVKQQILSFCLRHNYRFDGTINHWTQAHLKWLRALNPEGLYAEILKEYLLTYDKLTDKLERLDKRIEELAADEAYQENVRKLSCFIGVKTVTALAVLTEVGDFKRFSSAQHFASYIGLTPGEDSSGGDQNRLGITKAGNRHVRCLLVEAAQSYSRGQIGFKSKTLKARQNGNAPEVIAYADKANERLRRKYYRMVLKARLPAAVLRSLDPASPL